MEESYEVVSTISYGQFYLLGVGHLDPDGPYVDELVETALDGNGFAAATGTIVVLVSDLVDGYGELKLSVKQWSQSAPEADVGGFACTVVIGSDGLVLSTVEEATACRIDVAPGSYEVRISQLPSPTPGKVTSWSVQLFAVLDALVPAPKPRRSVSREQKVERIMAGLPHYGLGGAWWQFPRVRLDDEYDEILWEIAPTVKTPTIVNLYRTGVTRLPRWLTRVPTVVGLLAHGNDLDELPVWLAELDQLRRLAVSDNRRLTELPDCLAELPHLNRLEIDGTGISHVPDVVRHLRQLDRLDLSGTAITELPEWLGGLNTLTCLDLRESTLRQFPAAIQARIDSGSLKINT